MKLTHIDFEKFASSIESKDRRKSCPLIRSITMTSSGEKALNQKVRSRNTQSQADLRDLLPIPTRPKPVGVGESTCRVPAEIPPRGGHSKRRRRQRLQTAKRIDTMVWSLNSLGRGVVEAEPFHYIRSRLLANQRLATQLLEHSGGMARRAEKSAVSTCVLEEQNYEATILHQQLWLKSELLSLPPGGVAAKVKILEALPPEIGENYRTGEHIVRPRNEWIADIVQRPYMGVSQAEYHKLIWRLVDIGMVELRNTKPQVINGIFVVPKDDNLQRLIIDARNANKVFHPPPDPKLPNPGILADLQLPLGEKLFVAKSDLDNYYHRLRLPDWAVQYFGLPSIVKEGVRQWPVVLALPMGWSHSVYVAQSIHVEMLRRADVQVDRISTTSFSRFVITDFIYDAYIDDYFSLGTSAEMASERLGRVIKQSAQSLLPAKESKIDDPLRGAGKEKVAVLGLDIHKTGEIRPNPVKLVQLCAYTERFCSFRVWRRDLFLSLLGKWTWLLSLRRPMFSILSKVYSIRHTSSEIVVPSLEARRELLALVRLSSLIRADLTKEVAKYVICTDASLTGGGVVYCDAPTEFGRNSMFLQSKTDQDREVWVRAQSWKTAIRHKWYKPRPIHILEAEAILLALRWFTRDGENLNRRLVLFTDSQAVLGALRKGRSSVPSFNILCRKIAALTLVAQLKIDYFYIRTGSNPADGPSRFV